MIPHFDTTTAYGVVAAVAFCLTYLMRKLPVGSMLWAWIPERSRWLVPVAIAGGAAFFEAFQNSRPVIEALLVAVAAAMTASGIHHAASDSPLPYNEPKDPA